MAVALISVFSGLERTLGIFRRANFNSSGVAARRPRHDPRSALAIAGAGLQPEWQRHGMLAILARAASASTDPDRAVRPSNTAHSSSAIADIASITSLPFEFQSTRLFSSGLALTVRWPPFGLRLNRTPAPLVDAARAVYLKSETKFDVPLVRVHKADRP
jgi:hypothetical protein